MKKVLCLIIALVVLISTVSVNAAIEHESKTESQDTPTSNTIERSVITDNYPCQSSLERIPCYTDVSATAQNISNVYDVAVSSNESESLTQYPFETPAISKVEHLVNGLRVSWTNVGADRYRLYKKAEDGQWKAIYNADANTFSFSDTDFQNGEERLYTVRCISSDGKKFTSSFNRNGYYSRYHNKPVLFGTVATDEGIIIAWHKVGGRALYRVFRKENGSWVGLGNTYSTVFTDTTAISGNEYTYTVRCISEDLKSYITDYDTDGISCAYPLEAAPSEPTTEPSTEVPSEPLTEPLTEPTGAEPTVPTSEQPSEPSAELPSEGQDASMDGDPEKLIPRIAKIEIIPKATHEDWNNGIRNQEDYLAVYWEKLNEVRTYLIYFKNDGIWKKREYLMTDKMYIPITGEGSYVFAILGLDDTGNPAASPDDAKHTVTIKYVVDQEAYIDTWPIYEKIGYSACNKCGADVTGYIYERPDKIDEWYEKYLEWHYSIGYSWEPETKEEFGKTWTVVKYHCLIEGCSSAYHNEIRYEIVGYESEEISEEGHYEIVE